MKMDGISIMWMNQIIGNFKGTKVYEDLTPRQKEEIDDMTKKVNDFLGESKPLY
jgi:hypothetical protein